MSEPQPPPPVLRLKPRLRAPDEPGSAALAPAAEVPPPVTPSEAAPAPANPEAPAPKIQLKRREAAVPPADPAPHDGAAPLPPAPPPPPIFAPPATPAVVPPLFITDPPPPESPVVPTEVPAPAASEAGKFKLKPKAPAPVAPTAASVPPMVVPASVPTASATTPPVAVPAATEPPRPQTPPPFAPGAPGPKAPPPFPVVAQPKSSKSNPPMPVPRVNVKAGPLEVQPEALAATVPPKRSGSRVALLGGVLVVVLGAGGFFAWKHFLADQAPTLAAPKAKAPAAPSAGPTPSETLNKIAKAPGQAIDKAQDAIASRRASGQARVDAAADGLDVPDKPAPPAAAPANRPAASTKAVATTTIAPGLSATTQVEAAAEASPAFRSFVANAKVNGVFQGTPARAYINGRLLRAGETVDSALGIVFEGIDADKHQLLFKDRSGATVTRKY